MNSKEEISCDTLNSGIESVKGNEVQTFKQDNEPEKQNKNEGEESEENKDKALN